MYPTFRIGATNRCIDPTVDPGVDPAGMSLEEPFTGIDDGMNSSGAWKLSSSLIWRGNKKILQPPELNGRMRNNFSVLNAWCTC